MAPRTLKQLLKGKQPVYVVYGRHSSLPQDDGSSEERQLDMNYYRARAEHLALPLVEHPYYDRHKSGYHGDNLEAEFGRMTGTDTAMPFRTPAPTWVL